MKVPSRSNRNRACILYGVTIGASARKFLAGQLRFMDQQGWRVHLACAPEPGIETFARAENASYHRVQVVREPSPFADVKSLVRLVALISELRPAVIVMGTPKMALLGLTAGFISRVPRRIYVMHGLKLEGSRGLKRHVLTAFEKLSCAAATEVIAVSSSLRARALEMTLTPAGKIHVLRNGSANGFLGSEFPVVTPKARETARTNLGIPQDAKTVLCIGRVTRDKGLHDLFEIWPQVLSNLPNARLIVAGAQEPAGELDRRTISSLLDLDGVTYIPFSDDVNQLFASSDVMVMPTRREGLGNVAIEAALSGIPTVAYATTGTVDAVLPGITGELVTLGDRQALLESVLAILSGDSHPYDSRLMHALTVEKFDRTKLWQEWAQLLGSANSRSQP